MTESKFIIRLQEGQLHIQYKIEKVLLESILNNGCISDERIAVESEYRLKYTFSKKMRQAIRQGQNQQKSQFILENGPLIIAVQSGLLTFIFKGQFKLSNVKKTNDYYEIKVNQIPQLDLYIKFSETFYKNELSQHLLKGTKKTTIKKPEPSNKKVDSRKEGEKKSTQKKQGDSNLTHGSSIWAPDGSLIKKEHSVQPKIPPIYHSNSEFRNCGNCQNLNSNNYCSVQRKLVHNDDVCSRFYRFTIVLGGAVNPR